MYWFLLSSWFEITSLVLFSISKSNWPEFLRISLFPPPILLPESWGFRWLVTCFTWTLVCSQVLIIVWQAFTHWIIFPGTYVPKFIRPSSFPNGWQSLFFAFEYIMYFDHILSPYQLFSCSLGWDQVNMLNLTKKSPWGLNHTQKKWGTEESWEFVFLHWLSSNSHPSKHI